MSSLEKFHQTVWDFYIEHGRDMSWRIPESDGAFDPYKILVSEIMLQQTQVSRVVPKFNMFMKAFPDIQTLADATLSDVLKMWQGLGYSRRAKYLHATARSIVSDFNGKIPFDMHELTTLPGIGPNTAGAICVYAFNQPRLFIETNIRTVYMYHFFRNVSKVTDKEILRMLEKSIQHITESSTRASTSNNFREWYWALMDYGSYLKKTVGSLNKKSATYRKQPTFNGSLRQIRGQILKIIVQQKQSYDVLRHQISDSRLDTALKDLTSEGFIKLDNGMYEVV